MSGNVNKRSYHNDQGDNIIGRSIIADYIRSAGTSLSEPRENQAEHEGDQRPQEAGDKPPPGPEGDRAAAASCSAARSRHLGHSIFAGDEHEEEGRTTTGPG